MMYNMPLHGRSEAMCIILSCCPGMLVCCADMRGANLIICSVTQDPWDLQGQGSQGCQGQVQPLSYAQNSIRLDVAQAFLDQHN